MKTNLILIMLFCYVFASAQEEDIITLKPVIVTGEHFEKEEILLGLKKKTNSKFTGLPSHLYGLKIRNESHQKGKISNIILYLKKTDKDIPLTDIEIGFYTIDSITGLPDKKINHPKIVYKPENNKKGRKVIDIEDLNIPFPRNGVIITFKWLPISGHNIHQRLGPALRMTSYSNENLTYYRWIGGTWKQHLVVDPKHGNVYNLLAGIKAWVRKEETRKD